MADRVTLFLSANKSKRRGPYRTKYESSQSSRTTLWRQKRSEQSANTVNPEAFVNETKEFTVDMVDSDCQGDMDIGISDSVHEDLPTYAGSNIGFSEEYQECAKEPYTNHADDDIHVDINMDSEPYEPAECDSDKLYTGARLTLATSMFLTISLVMRHGASGQFFGDLLTLLEMFCPAENNFKGTLPMFKEYFTNSKEPVRRNYYCAYCTKFFGTVEADICTNCNSKDTSYFLSLPLENQLLNILKGKSLNYSQIRKKEKAANIEDVYDGNLYKQHFGEDGFFHDSSTEQKASEAHISLQLNTDGVAIFKSSSFSVWPLYAVINELNPTARFSRENRIFMGLWFGKCKPAMNMFLKPFMDESRYLFRTGVQIELSEGLKTVRSIILSVVADAPARCLMLHMMQYNGNYGCPCCLSTGESHAIGENGHSRIYRYDVNSETGHAEKRTHNSTLRFAKQASENYKNSRRAIPEPVMGVKGETSLLKAPGLDIIRGTTIDYMHCVLLGVMKMMLTLWFDVSHRTKPWSIRSSMNKINNRLLAIKPPNFVNRVPQSLEDLSQWKASELRSFLLFYSTPVLANILPAEYLLHFSLLQRAIFRLLKNSISQTDLKKAKALLKKFCLSMEQLYEDRYLTFNVHCLLHLTEKVEDLGPMWSHSCFFFEDLNGDLRSLFHGTNNVQNQIMFAVSLNQQLPDFQKELDSNIQAQTFYDNLIHKRHLNRSEEIDSQLHVVGRMIRATLSDEKRTVVENEVGQRVVGAFVFYRLAMAKYVIFCEDYLQVTRRNSFTVVYGDNQQIGVVKVFVKVILENGEAKYIALMNNLKPVTTGTVVDDVEHITPVTRTPTVVAIPVESIKELCVFMNFGNQPCGFVARSPNIVERE